MKKFLLTDEEIQEAVAFRRQRHEQPELGYEEYKTTEALRQKLQSWGVEILDTNL